MYPTIMESCVRLGLVVLVLQLTEVNSYPAILRVQPQQIHLAYGNAPNEMRISWSQLDKSNQSFVRYGLNGVLNHTKHATGSDFIDGGVEKRSQVIFRVHLSDLIPGKVYKYLVGNEYELSEEHTFQAMPAGQNWSPRLAVYGDMGNTNAQSLARLESEVYAGMYDAILHVGDFAYDMKDLEGEVGNEFMRQLEPISARVPYMTCPGNHEQAYNFSHYRNRFDMPGDNNRMYYSFNMGPVHIVSISTEFVFFPNYGLSQAFHQHDWFEKDLQEANKPENRAIRPWIVVFGHRPMYCSNTGNADCTKSQSVIRVGNATLGLKGFEDAMYQYGVDLAVFGHEHSYERLWPMYNRTVHNGSHSHPYTNPGAPVHIITGSAGCKEEVSTFKKKPKEWSAFRSDDYGNTRLHVLNRTHMHLEQVSDNKAGAIIDQFTIIKTSHGSYQKHGGSTAHG